MHNLSEHQPYVQTLMFDVRDNTGEVFRSSSAKSNDCERISWNGYSRFDCSRSWQGRMASHEPFLPANGSARLLRELVMTKRQLDQNIRMILQAYKAEYIDRFRDWEEMQTVLQKWEDEKKK